MSKNWYSEWYSQEGRSSKRIRSYIKIFLLLLVFSLVIYSFSRLNLQIHTFGWELFTRNIKSIFSFSNHNPDYPNYTMITVSLKLMWTTIRITILGTILGYFLSLISSFFASKHFSNWIFQILSSFIVIFFRSMPIIFLIYLFQNVFNKELCGVFVITWFTWLWCHKNMISIFHNQNPIYYKKSVAQKYSKFYSFKTQFIKRINNRMIGLFFYSFESNLRWTTILSTLGIVGIGELIINQKNFYHYSGIPLVVLFVSLIIFEILNIFIYKYLLQHKSKMKFQISWEWRKWIKNLLFFLFFLIAMYQIIIMNWKIQQLGFGRISDLFNADISSWTRSDSFNPWYGIWRLILDVITAIIIALIVGIFFAIFGNNIINSLPTSLFSRVWLILLKIIPSIMIILIFNPLFLDISSWINIILGIYSGLSLSKQLIDAINKIPIQIIYKLKLRGYSRTKIIWKYIIPFIKYDLIYYGFLSMEAMIRSFIILGAFGSSLAGSKINSLKVKNKYAELAGYILSLYIFYFLIEIIFLSTTYLLKRKSYLKKIRLSTFL